MKRSTLNIGLSSAWCYFDIDPVNVTPVIDQSCQLRKAQEINVTEDEGKMEENYDLMIEIIGKKILHWNFRGLSELPDELNICGGEIEELYLKENRITVIPCWIDRLKNLTNLYLPGNNLMNLPDEFGRMNQMRVLDLSGNCFEIIPDAIRQLTALKELIMDDNSLNYLPLELKDFSELESLSLSGNNFSTLPEWLGTLKNLKRLLVDNNCLEELPNRLTLAASLEIISVCSNRLKYLPLNSFISPTIVYFNGNLNLNYLSYPVMCQLLELGWDDGKSCFSNNLIVGELKSHKRIRLTVDFSTDKIEERAIIELPRQLIRAFNADNKEPPSLWELSLRNLYKNNSERYLNSSNYSEHDVFYNLLLNGPMSVCLNNQCQEPIFTEAWITIGSSDDVLLFVILLFCSRNCMITFDFVSHGMKILSWHC